MNTRTRNASPEPPASWNAAQTRQIAPHEGNRGFASIGTPVTPMVGNPSPSDSTSPAGKRNVELWLGRYAIGVVAAVLVFLGAAYFAIALIPQISDAVKMAIMFGASIALTAAGSILAIRRPNGFTMALMGCGAGSLFISVLVSRLYFGMLSELAALGLILVWMLMCLALIRKTQSLMLDIVMQLGLAVSVCMGYASGFDAGKLWLLVGYQLVASVIVVGGNLMFYRKMYRSSLVLALSLSLVTTFFIWDYCAPSQFGPFARVSEIDERPIGFAAAVFAVQFLSATAFAVCLAHSVLVGLASASRPDSIDTVGAAHVEGQGGRTFSYKVASALLVADAVLWVSAVRFDCLYAILYCLYNTPMFACSYPVAFAVGSAIMLVLMAGACVALMSYGRKQGIGADVAPLRPALTVFEWAGVVVALLGSLNAATFNDVLPIGLLWAWAAFVGVLGHRLGGRRFIVLTLTCLALEVAITCFGFFPGFPERLGYQASMITGATHAFTLCGLTGVLLYLQGWKKGNAVVLAVFSTILVMSYVSYCTPIAVEGWILSACGMTCALVWVILGFAMQHDKLRLSGLVVVLLCVFKLVAIDLAGLDPMSRTIAYIGGGLVCFVVSALYNFATRRISEAFGGR